MAVGLTGSEDPADPVFRDPKGRSLLRVLQFGPQNPAYGGAKISGDPIQNVFTERSGGTANCEHSQEMTPELLELTATGVYSYV